MKTNYRFKLRQHVPKKKRSVIKRALSAIRSEYVGISTAGAALIALVAYLQTQNVISNERLLNVYTQLVPQVRIGEYELDAEANSIVRLSLEVENRSVSPIRLLPIHPRLYDCQGNPSSFENVDGSLELVRRTDEDYVRRIRHPREASSTTPFASSKHSISINNIYGWTRRDLTSYRFSGPIVLEFRYVLFSDLSWRFEDEINDLNTQGESPPYGDKVELEQHIDPVPPVATTYSVVRSVLFIDGVATFPLRPVCRRGVRAVLAKE